MNESNLLSFGVKAVTSLSLLFMLSAQIQAAERTPIERPSVTATEKKSVKVKVSSGSSARQIEKAIQRTLTRNGYKASGNQRKRDNSYIQKFSRKIAKDMKEKPGDSAAGLIIIIIIYHDHIEIYIR